jgi:hypothetical protein
MLASLMRVRINSPKVIHQIFETEVVIVNLETGNYYSVGGSGIEIWRSLDAGIPPAQIAAAFASLGAEAEAKSFLQELEREQLIVPTDEPTKTTASKILDGVRTFSPPTLEKFTDMREMLLVDPIHELDESGWPKPAPSPEQQ